MKKAGKSVSYTDILKYTSLFGGVQALNILVGIVRNKLVAIILGPYGMGLISLFNSSIKLVSDSTNFGISMSGVKNISESYDKNDIAKLEQDILLVRSWSVLTALIGMLLCIFLSPWLSRFTFSWDGHTLHFILLSPMVALTAISGGELAILKGVRKLRALAKISIYNVVAALFISVPLYYCFSAKAIVPSLVMTAFVQMLITIAYSFKLYPFKISISRQILKRGTAMIKLGIAFVIAGVMGSGADFLIRSFLNNATSIDMVGLFSAGYMMTMTYVSMVFSAMETDYFPRLSGVCNRHFTFVQTVNRQIEVMLLVVAPLLVAFSIFLPILLPLLYTGKFAPALGMMRIIIIAMYFRALKLPVQYIPLAKGDSRSYLLLEGIYSIIIVIAVVLCFNRWGLTGAGIAITSASFIDLLITFIYARWHFDYSPSPILYKYALIQIGIGLLTYLSTIFTNQWVYWSTGLVLIALSTVYSAYILRSKVEFIETLQRKFGRIFGYTHQQ